MSVATITATELAEAIRTKQASSREVIEAHLRRIEAVNPSINAVTMVLGEQAIEAAKAADRAVAAGGDLPRFHGVPFTVKGTSTWSVPQPRTEPRRWWAPFRRWTHPWSSASRLPGRSRSAAPTCPPSRCAGTPTASSMAPRSTPGPGWRDPWSVPAPLRGPEPTKPVRVALVVDPAGLGTANQVQRGVRKAARALVDAGYVVEEVEPPSIDLAARILLDMLNTPDVRAMWQLGSPMMPADTRRFLSEFYRVAGDPDPVMTMQSFATRQSLLRAWGQFQQQHPLIVAPICTEVPFQASADLDEGRVAETIRSMRMAIAVNALGLPAVALPVGIGDGLPQAVQVIGPRYREDLCLAAAAALEDRVGTITPIDPRWR